MIRFSFRMHYVTLPTSMLGAVWRQNCPQVITNVNFLWRRGLVPCSFWLYEFNFEETKYE